jgi:hypothetical protein
MKVIVIALLTTFLSLTIFAQEASTNKNYLWKTGLHMGSAMLWGDISDDCDPFTKMFSSQSKLSFEFDLHRKITNVFGVEGSFLFGKLAGQRTSWSDDKPAGLGFNTSFMDYSLSFTADLTALFGAKPDRLISFYVLGGGGLTNYNATEYDISTGKTTSTTSNQTFFVPWGWGMSFNLTPKFSIFAQNTFRHPFTDDVDAHIGVGTNIDDIYSFTSIGASYKFGPKKVKQKKIEIVPVEVDTTVAKEDNYVPVNVSTIVNMPSSIKPNETKTVNVTINKGNLTDKGEYIQTFPDGFMIESRDNAGGTFSFDVGKLTLHWDNMPETENLTFSYDIKAGDITPNTYNIPGTFVYSEKEKIKVKQFKNNLTVTGPVVAQNNASDLNQEDKPATGEVKQNPGTPVEVNNQKQEAGISFAVQVAAVYGGKMNPASIQKQYRLNETVNESSYKGYNNYTVGNFANYSAANERRKGTKVRGAYVVAFKDGKYQPHLYYINTDVMDKNPFVADGTTYKVQVSASKGRPYAIVKLASKLSIEPGQIYEDKTGNWYQYTTGTFSTPEEAKAYAKKLRDAGATDAYVVKFVNGVRTR